MTPIRFPALRHIVVAAVLALLVSGCGTPDNLFVLLDNPDGKTGSIEVTNAGGKRVLDQPGQATGVSGAASAPIEPVALEQQSIDVIFGPTFEAQPAPPSNFILYFRTGTTTLTQASRRKIEDVFAAVGEHQYPIIAVVGHTDRYGSARNNETLALRRAQAVADLLVSAGADPKLIELSSHGENNPLVPTPDQVRERRNRRVEITVR